LPSLIGERAVEEDETFSEGTDMGIKVPVDTEVEETGTRGGA
jgi:hypothetical protein